MSGQVMYSRIQGTISKEQRAGSAGYQILTSFFFFSVHDMMHFNLSSMQENIVFLFAY